MLSPTQLNELSKQAAGFPGVLSAMQSDLAKQTKLLEHLEELTEGSQPKIKPLPQYLDLTQANPSLVTGETLRFIRAWFSSPVTVAATLFTLHIGEAGVFYNFWLPVGGGVFNILPADDEYPLVVGRGVRVWIEEPQQGPDFHCKLIAFPT